MRTLRHEDAEELESNLVGGEVVTFIEWPPATQRMLACGYLRECSLNEDFFGLEVTPAGLLALRCYRAARALELQ